jgi:AcrR family transcriptional regulator
MTKKKQDIINAALELFAEEGFKSTSTNRVALKAGVSEGLIFRHFKNKNGLLEAIIQEGQTRAVELFSGILSEQDPKAVIKKTIELVLNLTKAPEEASFWKLQYKIKWELEHYNKEKMQPIVDKLTQAFIELRYKNPEAESQLILIQLDGLIARYFLQGDFNVDSMVQFLIKKYGV